LQSLVIDIDDKAHFRRQVSRNQPYTFGNEVIPMKKVGIFLSYLCMAVLCVAVALIAWGGAQGGETAPGIASSGEQAAQR